MSLFFFLLQFSAEPPKLQSAGGGSGRNALLADIQKGAKLKKVTQVNDRSAPAVDSEWKKHICRVCVCVCVQTCNDAHMTEALSHLLSLRTLLSGGSSVQQIWSRRDLA